MAENSPFTQAQFAEKIEKMTMQREELLGLIRPLANGMRNWKPNNEQRSIHEILVHIGNTECHAVSQLGKKLSGPSEVTLMRYLHQSREAVLSRLHQLAAGQLNEEFAGGSRVDTILDHILAHDLYHIEQIREILAQWRLHLLARLEAERAGLFTMLLGLSAEQLNTAEPIPGWTIKDLLAHVAFWDGFHTNRMQLVADGRVQEIMEIGDDADMDAFNARLLAEQKEIPLEQVIAMLQKERGGFMQLLARLNDVELQGQIRLPWGWRTHMRVWAKWRYQHDAEHAGHIQAWRDTLSRTEKRHNGTTLLLRTLLKACRKEFVALLPLLPESERESRPVCGVWSLKDLVGHLAAWAEVGVAGLASVLEGKLPDLEPIPDFEAWNLQQAAQRADWSWEAIWQAYEVSYGALLAGVDELTEEQLAEEFDAPWGPTLSLYRWLTIWPLHEREHAIDVRHALNLTRWPKRLTEHPER